MNYNEKYTHFTAELRRTIRERKSIPTVRFAWNNTPFDVADRQQRIRLIDAMTRDYMAEHAAYNQRALDRWKDGGCRGERPKTVDANTALLESLADAILDEELTDDDAHKSAHNEYPILSDYQLGRRHDREVSLWVAEALGTDGVDHRPKKRRMRSKWENEYVDKHAKIRNKQRAADYRREVAPGTITSYFLSDTGGAFTDDFVQCQGIGEKWRNRLSLVYEITDN